VGSRDDAGEDVENQRSSHESSKQDGKIFRITVIKNRSLYI